MGLASQDRQQSHDGRVRVRLAVGRVVSGITCLVDSDQNAFLRFTHEGSIIRVRGVISELVQWDITLRDATVALLRAAPPKNPIGK